MNWLSKFLTSSIGNKVLISATGLFLTLFLFVHLLGNLTLLIDDEGRRFNAYSDIMSTNLLITVIAYALYASILLHAIKGIAIYNKNRKARGNIKYAVNAKVGASWASRNMAFLGSLVFIFIAMHMAHFWFKFKFGWIDANHDDWTHFDVVNRGFKQAWIVGLYVVAMIPLAWHLIHGFQSAFQTLGLRQGKYTGIIQSFGWGFSVIVPLCFAIIPILVYFGIYPLPDFAVIPGQGYGEEAKQVVGKFSELIK